NAIYTGSPYTGPVTCSAVGPNGEILPSSLTYVGTSSTSYASSSTPPTSAGNYNAVCTVGGTVNYTSTSKAAAFTISPKSASVTPASATKVYGSRDPALTGTLSGFVAADSVAAIYSRTAGETVAGGPYSITA